MDDCDLFIGFLLRVILSHSRGCAAPTIDESLLCRAGTARRLRLSAGSARPTTEDISE